jgi:hypothetical protein
MAIRALQGAAISTVTWLQMKVMPSLWSPLVIILWLHSHSVSCNYPTYYSSPFTLSFTNLIMPSKFSCPNKFSNKAKTKNLHTTDQIPLTENKLWSTWLQWVIQFKHMRISTTWQMKTEQAWALDVRCWLFSSGSHHKKMFGLNGAICSYSYRRTKDFHFTAVMLLTNDHKLHFWTWITRD